MRTLVASMILLASLSIVSAQEQERKLIDRLLRPDMSLTNSAQNIQFRTSASNGFSQVSKDDYWLPVKAFEKSFPASKPFQTSQFATAQFQPHKETPNIPLKFQPPNRNSIELPSASSENRVAAEDRRKLSPSRFSADRPSSDQNKLWKELAGRDVPLTIEQVRELLNKNK